METRETRKVRQKYDKIAQKQAKRLPWEAFCPSCFQKPVIVLPAIDHIFDVGGILFDLTGQEVPFSKEQLPIFLVVNSPERSAGFR